MSWLGGEQADAQLHVQVRPVPVELTQGGGSPAQREAVQAWLGQLWEEKDQRLQRGLARSASENLASAS